MTTATHTTPTLYAAILARLATPASGLPPGHAEYHTPHLAGCDDRERVPVREVECPACIGYRPARWDCASCGGVGQVGVERAVAWELERMAFDGDGCVLGYRGYAAEGGPVRWQESDRLVLDYDEWRDGITTAELARRLAPAWRWVRAGECVMEPVDTPATHDTVHTGYTLKRKTCDVCGGNGVYDYIDGLGERECTGCDGLGERFFRWDRHSLITADDERGHRARRKSADPCVLSTGRVVERAFIGG